jgi:hypothetical protein
MCIIKERMKFIAYIPPNINGPPPGSSFMWAPDRQFLSASQLQPKLYKQVAIFFERTLPNSGRPPFEKLHSSQQIKQDGITVMKTISPRYLTGKTFSRDSQQPFATG